VKQVMKANVNILEVKQVTYLALAGWYPFDCLPLVSVRHVTV
jgi:hypothetical protein